MTMRVLNGPVGRSGLPVTIRSGAVSRMCLVIGLFSTSPAQAQQRPLVVDDLFTLEQLGRVVASPDGKRLAVEIARPRSGAETYRDFPFPGDPDHADIWLIDLRTGERRNLTNGLADGSGYWGPVWSPDGRRIAFLSTQGQDNVRPYVWEMATGALRRLTERGAELLANGAEPWPGHLSYAMIWKDNTTLLCAVQPEGQPPSLGALWHGFMSGAGSQRTALKEWDKAADGVEASVSVLESGREIPEGERRRGQLLAIEVISGRSQVVAEGNFRFLSVGPTGRYLALITESGKIPPQPERKITYLERWRESWRTRLALLPLDDKNGSPKWIDAVVDPRLAPFGAASFHRWSPDGSSLAVIARGAKEDESPASLFLVSARTGVARRLTGPEVEVSSTAWSGGGELLALMRSRQPGVAGDQAGRFDWWLIERSGGGKMRKLTAGLETVPQDLRRTPLGNTMVGLSAGDVWTISLSGRSGNLTDTMGVRFKEIVWPSTGDQGPSPQEELVLQDEDGNLRTVTWTRQGPNITPLPRPSREATLAEFQPDRDLTVFAGTASNGTFLWTGRPNSRSFIRHLALNEHVKQIADPKRLLVEYQGVDGDSLRALLVLPVGYEQGKRYPLVTWVYGGYVVTDTSPAHYPLDKQSPLFSLNPLLLPAHGYALLMPSMPLPPDGSSSDPYLEIPKGVFGAINRAIDLGVADPNKLGLMGQSFGGYSTYALVTYTHRFKAAVVLAGFADLAGLYGTFSPGTRYADLAHEDLFYPSLSESGQFIMGETPQENLWRYLRNSPLNFADRVRTPLMIMHGDGDLPIQQAEQFFAALYRMGKPARFVRYWGEGHVIQSPANIRDMWQRIFGWFDEHLKGDKAEAPPTSSSSIPPAPTRTTPPPSGTAMTDTGTVR